MSNIRHRPGQLGTAAGIEPEGWLAHEGAEDGPVVGAGCSKQEAIDDARTRTSAELHVVPCSMEERNAEMERLPQGGSDV